MNSSREAEGDECGGRLSIAEEAHPQTVSEVSEYITKSLSILQEQLDLMSNQMLSKMDEMGSRMDKLESSIGEILTQADNDSRASSAS
ncbi:hypothetical protein DFJ77DRAFT_156028 [Powellomyces hirtus]|nr:hypothetical protein DFJ77DRAFT_156028 [Powellomyces hirtus]